MITLTSPRPGPPVWQHSGFSIAFYDERNVCRNEKPFAEAEGSEVIVMLPNVLGCKSVPRFKTRGVECSDLTTKSLTA